MWSSAIWGSGIGTGSGRRGGVRRIGSLLAAVSPQPRKEARKLARLRSVMTDLDLGGDHTGAGVPVRFGQSVVEDGARPGGDLSQDRLGIAEVDLDKPGRADLDLQRRCVALLQPYPCRQTVTGSFQYVDDRVP